MYQTSARMAAKLAAVPFPTDLTRKTMLDIGCDHGWWVDLALRRGADYVVGIDRGRDVTGRGWVDIVAENTAKGWPRCSFVAADVGKEWPSLGPFSLVLCFSSYHHIWANCGDHQAIWRWLRRCTKADGMVLWEGPTSVEDPVAFTCAKRRGAFYFEHEIAAAADTYFVREEIGKAGHVLTREVWRCLPRKAWEGHVVAGAGGATAAFLYAHGRRIKELALLLGERPYPGSLNVELAKSFDWSSSAVAGPVLDVVARGRGLEVAWAPRIARCYAVTVNGLSPAWAFRFEGERYADTFLEIVSPLHLREHLVGEDVLVCRA